MSIRHITKVFFITVFITCLTALSFAQVALPSGVTKGATVEGITEYKLENGMKILLFKDDSKPTITVSLTYLVGSRHENYGETGMAHLLEHLLFKGTPKHPDIIGEMNKRGALNNASTSYDMTNYFEIIPATNENLEWAIELEADRMINSNFGQKDLDSEFSVVRNEMERGENSAPGTTLFSLVSAAYKWHNYGKSTIGARSDVENVPLNKLRDFYKKYYRPDNVVLVLAGNFEEGKALGYVQKHFGAIKRPSEKIPPIYTVEPTQDGEREVTIRRSGKIQLAMAGYHIPPGTHPDFASISVLAGLLTDNPSGTLHKKLVDTKKANSLLFQQFALKDPGYITFIAVMGASAPIDDVTNDLVGTIESFAATPSSKDKVDRIKKRLLVRTENSLNIPAIVGIMFASSIAQGDWRGFFIHRDRIKNVTPADVQRVAKKYFKRSNRTVGKFIPTEKADRAEIPLVSEEEFAKIANAYKGGKAVAKGEAFDPSPANVESRLKRSKIGGLDVALLSKENRGDAVNAAITLRFGDGKSLKGRGFAGGFIPDLFEAGTATMGRQALEDAFDRLKSEVSFSGDEMSTTITIRTSRESLAESIKLVGNVLKKPALPVADFEKAKLAQVSEVENQSDNPEQIAYNVMYRHLNLYPKGHPKYTFTVKEKLEGIKATNIADVRSFHKDFYGASSGQVAIVGDFDEKEITSVLEATFANWKSAKPYVRIDTKHPNSKPIDVNIETPDKANAFFLARSDIKIRDDSPDYPALLLGNHILGGGALNSRLANRIREKDGLSYGVSSRLEVSSVVRNGYIEVKAIYAPENKEKLERAFKEEVTKIIKFGYTAEEVENAKSGWLKVEQSVRSFDITLATQIITNQHNGRTLSWDRDLEAKIAKLTVEEVNAVIKKYLDLSNFSVVRSGDFAKSNTRE